MENIKDTIQSMREHNMQSINEYIYINIKDAKEKLKYTLQYYLTRARKNMLWLPSYEQVAEWLSNNNGKGLFLYGNVGVGKTLIGSHCIPCILLNQMQKVVKTYSTDEMKSNIDTIKSCRIASLDDIGLESEINHFGNKRNAFNEIVDNAEKKNNLLIITSNLTMAKIHEKYGTRTADRLRAIVKMIHIKHDSSLR